MERMEFPGTDLEVKVFNLKEESYLPSALPYGRFVLLLSGEGRFIKGQNKGFMVLRKGRREPLGGKHREAKMKEIQELIEELVHEHRIFLKELEGIESDLSEENIRRLISLLRNEIEEHALKEERDLRSLAEDRFDFEAIVFAHEQVRMALEELEENPDPPTARRAIGVLRSHFMEEENIFFPQMLGFEPATGGEG